MVKNKPTILIGTLTRENIGPISTITRVFIKELSDKYIFIPYFADRKFGHGGLGKLNIINVYYLIKHTCLWFIKLVKYRPNIAHYPFTSFWNIEKCLIFLMVAKIFSDKVIAHLHGGVFDDYWIRLNPIRKKIALKALYRLDAMIVLSEGWKKWVCYNIGLDEKKVMVVNNPIDSDFQKKAIAFKRNENNNMFFMGSLGKRKGVYDILEVASELNNKGVSHMIYIAGNEEYCGDLKKIKKIITQRQLNQVQIIGPLYGKEKIKYFEQNSIFLLPSYNENFPLVVIEAAAAGKAIVTTRVGAIPEFFEHNESVLFVEPGNVGQIVNSVVELISNHEMRYKLEAGARQTYIDKLSSDKIIKSLHYVYQHVLAI